VWIAKTMLKRIKSAGNRRFRDSQEEDWLKQKFP
jgi:hypothetical protein